MNRWYFWVLAPVMLGSAAILVFIVPAPPTLMGHILGYGIAACLVLATLGLANPGTFAWALRLVAAGVFAGCLSYVVNEFGDWRAGEPFMGGRRSGTNLFNALCAFTVFGVPAVRFMLAGRSESAVDAIITDDSEQNDDEAADRRSGTISAEGREQGQHGMLADALRRLAGLRLKDEDGQEQILELQPPATEEEIQTLAGRLPCPIPDDIRSALRVSKGLVNGPLESFSLVDLEGFGLDELLPHAYSIARDGFGNYWVLDLLPGTIKWGPVFYACHDPAVLAYQSATIEEFLEDMIALWQAGRRSPVDFVHEEVVNRIWRENPGALTRADLEHSADTTLRAFAAQLSSAAVVVDLRHAALGQGLSWGRFGSKTTVRRAGEERVWALSPPERRRGLLARLFQRSDGAA